MMVGAMTKDWAEQKDVSKEKITKCSAKLACLCEPSFIYEMSFISRPDRFVSMQDAQVIEQAPLALDQFGHGWRCLCCFTVWTFNLCGLPRPQESKRYEANALAFVIPTMAKPTTPFTALYRCF